MNKPNYIETQTKIKIEKLLKKFLLEALDAKEEWDASQYTDKIYALLEEQAAGFEKDLTEIQEEDYAEEKIHKLDLLADRLRDRLKEMRGK